MKVKNSIKFFFLLSLFALSCSKESETSKRIGDDEDQYYISEIATVNTENIRLDTIWEDMEDYEQTFVPAVSKVDFGKLFTNVKDSLEIQLDLPQHLNFKHKVELPLIKMDNFNWFSTPEDSLSISHAIVDTTFISSQRPVITQFITGNINKVKVNRKYQRIIYSGDLVMNMILSNGGNQYIRGKFTASKMGTTKSDIYTE